MPNSQTGATTHLRGFAGSVAKRAEGASAVEYGLLIAFIAIVIIVAVAVLGVNLQGTFSEIATGVA
jgi:pilus assembly protein Flp/PilA